MIPLYDGPVVGVSFEPSRTNLRNLYTFVVETVGKVGEIELDVKLVHNPLNPWDSNAVQVHIGYHGNMFFIGHIPKTHNTNLLAEGLDKLKCEFIRFNFGEEPGVPVGAAIVVNKEPEYENSDAYEDVAEYENDPLEFDQ